MGLLSKLFGSRRRRARRAPRFYRAEDYAPPKKARPGYVLLRRGHRYRWTLRFTNVQGGKLRAELVDEIIRSERAQEQGQTVRVLQRNPLVLSYVVGQPLTAEIPIGRKSKHRPQAWSGVRETTVSVVEV